MRQLITADSRQKLLDSSIIVLFSWASLSINRYEYGTSNHAIVIPFMKSFLHPDLYPGDYLIAQRPYFFTHLWNGLALISEHLHIDLPILFFGTYCFSLLLTFIAVYLLALALFHKKEVAYLSLFFFTFQKTLLGLGGLPTHLDTIVVATPILIFAIYFFFQGKYPASFFLQGFAFLIHPLSAVYVIAFLGVSSIVILKSIGKARLALCVGLLALTAAPSIVWKLSSTPASLHLVSADWSWVALLHLRSSHHLFPSTWKKDDFVRTGLLLYIFFVSWKHRPHSLHQRVVLSITATIFAMWLIGTIFTEVIPVSIVLQFQLFRSSIWFLLFACLYYANYLYRELRADHDASHLYLVTFLSFGIFFGAGKGYVAFVSLAALATAWLLYRAITCASPSDRQLAFSLAAVAALFSAAPVLRGRHLFAYDAPSAWKEVQLWAREHTQRADLFVVPPQLTGFRIESERSVYCEWKDGTQMFFNPSFGTEWIRRMRMLGYKGSPSPSDDLLRKHYESLDENGFKAIAQEGTFPRSNVYVVMAKERPLLNFPTVYANNHFVVFKATNESVR